MHERSLSSQYLDAILPPLIWIPNGEGPMPESQPLWSAYTGQSSNQASRWGWLATLAPDDHWLMQQTWLQALQVKRYFVVPCHIRRRDDTYATLHFQAIPMFEAGHTIKEWICILSRRQGTHETLLEDSTTGSMYRLMFEQAAIGIYTLSLDGHFIKVNKHFCDILGYTYEEMLQMHIRQIDYQGDLHLTYKALHAMLLGTSSVILQKRYVRKNGTIVWVKVKGTIIRAASGFVHSYLAFVDDITDRVRAEEERMRLLEREKLARAEADKRSRQLGAIFSSIADVVVVCDHMGNIIQANEAALKLLPPDLSPVLRMSFEERMHFFRMRDEHGRPLSLYDEPSRRVLRGAVLQGKHAQEVSIVRPNGQEMHVSVTGAPIRDEHQHIIGAVLVFRDVTERRQLERRVQNALGALLTVVKELVHIIGKESAIPQKDDPLAIVRNVGYRLATLTYHVINCQFVGISLLDAEKKSIQPLAIMGPSPEIVERIRMSVTGMTLQDLFDAQVIERLYQNEAVVCDVEMKLAGFPERTPYPMSNLLVAPMFIGNDMVGVIGVGKGSSEQHTYTTEEFDLVKAIATLILLVIERERLQQEWLLAHTNEMVLQELNRRFDEFLGIASHELRTPLATIKGNIQLAQRRLQTLQKEEDRAVLNKKLERVREGLSDADHRVNVQDRMIGDLLDVSRIRAGTFSLALHPLNLQAIVRDAVEDQRHMHPQRTISLTVPEQDPITVLADADRLGQVIHNYITNALKYSPPDRPVHVALTYEQDQAQVAVYDQGQGLSEEEQKHIWERFYRVKGIEVQSGSDEGTGGLGLGLHICRTIIEHHHGLFGLKSTPGQGSIFWFSLSIYKEQEHHPSS